MDAGWVTEWGSVGCECFPRQTALLSPHEGFGVEAWHGGSPVCASWPAMKQPRGCEMLWPRWSRIKAWFPDAGSATVDLRSGVGRSESVKAIRWA